MTDFDLSAFHHETFGLPDRSILDEKGQPSVQVLERTLGFSRENRRYWASHETDPLRLYCARKARAVGFCVQANHYRKLRSPILLKGDRAASWETQVFQRFLPNWHLTNTDDAFGDQYAALSNDERETLSIWFSAYAGPEGKADLLLCVAQVRLALLTALEKWPDYDKDRKSLLADVAFGLFTLFGPECLKELVESEPELLGHYGYVLSGGEKATGTRGNMEDDNNCFVEGASFADGAQLTTGPESLSTFYLQLASLAADGAINPRDLSIADRVEVLITTYLPRLRKQLSLTQVEVRQLVNDFVSFIFGTGEGFQLTDFKDPEFTCVFSDTWIVHINHQCERETPLNYFSAQAARVLGTRTLAKQLRQARADLQEASQDVSSHLASVDRSGFRQRRELEAAIAAAQQREGQRRRQFSTLEDQVIAALLPEGQSIADLPEKSSGLVLTPEHFHPSAIQALIEWRNAKPSLLRDEPFDNTVKPAAEMESASGSETSSTAAPGEEVSPVPSAEFNQTAPAEPSSPVPEPPEAAFIVANVPAPTTRASEPVALEPTVTNAPTEIGEIETTTDYVANVAEACDALIRRYNHFGKASAAAVENVALHWLVQGHLNAAYATLTIAESTLFVDGEVMPPALFRAAFFGMNVWPGDQAAVTSIQRQLNFLAPQNLDDLLERRPGGRVVPYLIFSAAFQPTLFAGNFTMAPRLLRQIVDSFDGATQRMLRELVEFTDRGHRLDLDILRKQTPIDDRQQRAKLATRLSDWRDRITNKQTGWAPARKALRDCLTRPELASAMNAIEKDIASDSLTVQSFVDKYGESDAVTELMHEQVNKVQSGDNSAPPIERQARSWFQHSIGEFRDIASDWLIEYHNRSSRKDETRMFANRFLTQLRTVQDELQHRVERTNALEHRCAGALALKAVSNLLRAVEGDVSVIWSAGRAEACMALPFELMESEGLKSDPERQFFWLVEHCKAGLDPVSITEAALGSRNFRLARLLLLQRRDSGEEVTPQLQDVDKRSGEARHLLARKAQQLRTMVDNAVLATLIDDERAYQLSSELEYAVESINRLDTLDSLRDIEEDLALREVDLDAKFTEAQVRLQTQLDELLIQARVQVGNEAVADNWLNQVTRALADRNLSVVEEMLDHLKTSIRDGVPVKVEEIGANPYLTGFLAKEAMLFEFIHNHPNPREIGRQLIANPPVGLDFAHAGPGFREAVEALADWKIHPPKHSDKLFYDSLVQVLGYLGFRASDPTFRSDKVPTLAFDRGATFSRASMMVKPADTGHPFPLFGQDAPISQINVVLAFREWTPQELKQYIDVLGMPHQRTVFISANPVSNEARNALAAQSKEDQFTVFHLDPVILAYLGGMTEYSSRLRNFLRLSVPWTYFNPYTPQDTRRPAPPEMRYGRRNDVQRLTAMQGGAAIIYGGRQLGKTTILHEAVRSFNNPSEKHYAFYSQMDRDMARLQGLSEKAWQDARTRVWREIYQGLVKAGMLRETPGISTNTDSMVNAVTDKLRQDGSERVLMCFDEIDPILELDSANGFALFRGLSDLVNQPNGRFKVVIAGLQNVKRFQDAPNFPLPQLGSSIEVSILPTPDAIQLVREPLQVLGYEFEDPLLANRILVATNRHPGLIHIFCHELVSWMAKRHQKSVGNVLITAADVDRIAKDPAVLDLIRSRFDMTLNLDKRYLVIVYGLIAHNRTTGSFTAAQAKSIAEGWLPDAFKHLTEKQFEAFLDELVGLGVLRLNPSEGRNEYSLRSVNILNLVGSPREIDDKLLRAIADIVVDDPLSGHAFPKDAPCPSPLTLRDEKQLISVDNSGAREVGDRSSMYSVGIITGSEALGLDVAKFEATLPTIGEFENSRVQGAAPRYTVKYFEDTGLPRASHFRSRLETAVSTLSKAKPIMLIVIVDGAMPLTHTLDMLDIAHELSAQATKLVHRVRVLFLLGPKALWQWEESAALTRERETQQVFIGLDLWNHTALSHLLNHLGLENTASEVDELLKFSQGWYFSLDILVQSRMTKRQKAVRLSDFRPAYVPLLEAKPKDLGIFLGKTGLAAVPWGIPLARRLSLSDTFDIEDLQLTLMEPEFDLDAELAPTILRWMERLRLVSSTVDRTRSDKIIFRITESVAAALKVAVTTKERG